MAKKVFLLLSILFIFFSCKNKTRLEKSLNFAGKNRFQLEKTLEYYRTMQPDTLKYKAAIFLIENMITHYSYKSDIYKKINQDLMPQDYQNNISKLKILYKEYHNTFNIKVYDCQIITAEYLIENIELAFKVWQEKPWSRKINFESFCEHILPYRVGNEPIDYWRKEAFNKFNEKLNILTNENSIYNVASIINTIIKKESFEYVGELSFAPDLGYKVLAKYRMGYCRNSAQYVTYCMRAMGIPAGNDFVIQWGNRSGAHIWNFVIDEKGKSWM